MRGNGNHCIWTLIVVWKYVICLADASNILIFQPYPFKSHYIAFEPLITGLVNRGHNVTAINHFPTGVKTENYSEIDISNCISEVNMTKVTVEYAFQNSRSIIQKMNHFYTDLDVDAEIVSCNILKSILRNGVKYDLIITEIFYAELYYWYIYQFNVPFIILYANWLPPWISCKISTPNNPSYISHTHNPLSFDVKKPSFYERLFNTYIYLYINYMFNTILLTKSQDIIEKNYDFPIPPLSDIVKNASLIFAFSNFITNGPKPVLPSVIEVGGIHLKPSSPIPQDIEKFINESEHGVIYFSMGSLLRSETMPEAKRDAFLRAFAKIPQRILWKWKGEFPGKTNNLLVSEWFPQRDILAHPKVKLFISHGGSLGINEAIHEAVPVLGIPIYGDQKINIQNLLTYGSADLLEYTDITEETVLEKLRTILKDKRYKENAEKLSIIYRDRPMSPLDSAIYWTEYVVRHKGAHHLRSAAVNLSWYQYLLLDVIAFVLVVSILILYIFYRTSKSLLRIFSKKSNHSERKKRQ